MSTKRNRRSQSSDAESAAEDILKVIFRQSKAQFGDAVTGFWFYDGDFCPGCLPNSAGAVNFKGKEALSINAFIYRERGILIGYFLCEICTLFVHEQAQKHPHQQTPLHAQIESNLTAAYHMHLASLDA